MITFETDPVNYCSRFPDPRCGISTASPLYDTGASVRRGGSGFNEADAIRQTIDQVDQLLSYYPGNRKLLAQRKKLVRQLAVVQKKYGLLGLGEDSGAGSVLVWAFAGYIAYKYLFKGR